MIDRLTSGLQDFADSIVNPSSWKQTSSVNVLPLENQFGSYVPIKLDPKVLVDKEEDLLDPTQCGHRSDPSLPPPTARHLPRGRGNWTLLIHIYLSLFLNALKADTLYILASRHNFLGTEFSNDTNK